MQSAVLASSYSADMDNSLFFRLRINMRNKIKTNREQNDINKRRRSRPVF